MTEVADPGPELAGPGDASVEAAWETRGGLVRAGIVLTALYLVSRLLGWLRLSVLAATFGTGRELDMFYSAFRIPDLMFQLVAAGALASALIPMIAGLLATGERDRAWRVTSTVTNLMLLALLVLSAIFEVAAPVIVPAITPDFSPTELASTVDLTRIMLASPILLALGTVATSALNAQGRFGAAALAPVVYNLGIIAGALLLSAPLGVTGLALGVVAGSVAHLGVQVRPLLRTGFHYRPSIDLRDPRARQTLVLLAPRAFGLGATQVVYLVVTSVASTLGTGAITEYNFAFSMLQIPIGVVGIPLGAVVFPSLARDHATGSSPDFVSLLMRASRLVVFLMLPLTGLVIVLSRPAVTVLFEYGRYDPVVTATIAATLSFFVLGLVAHAILPVLARAFYARQDTLTPVLAALLTVVLNSALAVALAGPYGLVGIATSFTIANGIEMIVLLVVLQHRLPAFDLAALGRLFLEAGAGTIAASVVAAFALGIVFGSTQAAAGKVASVAELVVGTVAFGVVFIALSSVMRIPELPSLVGYLARAAGRAGPGGASR